MSSDLDSDILNHADEILIELGIYSSFEESLNLLIKISDKEFDEDYRETVRVMLLKQYITGYLNSLHYLMHDLHVTISNKEKINKSERFLYSEFISKISDLITRI